MKRRRFFRQVLFPAFVPLLLIALGRTILPPFSSRWIAAALLLASAVLYLRRLWEYWGYADDVRTEIRRYKLLILLILILFPLNLGFLFSVSVIPVRDALVLIFLITGGASFFLLLTLLLQFIRFSSEIKPKSFRVAAGLLIAIALIFSGGNVGVGFLIFFLLAVWIFSFEALARIGARQKIALTFFSIIGIIFLGGLTSNSSSFVTSADTVNTLVLDSMRVIEAGLLPFLTEFIGSLRRLILALFIVLPGKIILRPVADWLKYSLRIRTKLVLSYIFSSIIPVFLLLVILLFGVFFLMGGFWQLFINELLESRADTMESLWDSVAPEYKYDSTEIVAADEKTLSNYLEANGITAVFAEVTGEKQLGEIRFIGAPLPELVPTENTEPELNEEEDNLNLDHSIGTRLPIRDFVGFPLPELGDADSLLVKMSEEDFSGLAWLGDTPYLNRWVRQGNRILGLFRPFTMGDLAGIKARSGADLMVFHGRDFQFGELTSGGIIVQMESSVRANLQTEETPPQRGLLDYHLSFPILVKSLAWEGGSDVQRLFSVIIVRASLAKMFAAILSPKQYVNRIYLAIFAVMAAIFGVILILVALVGFSLAGGITRTIAKVRRGTQQLRKGDLTVNIEVKTKDELGELAESFNLMVADLNRMLVEVREKEHLEAELEAAKAIQTRLLPERIPQLPGFEIAATSLAAKQVGGDYYDFFDLPTNRLGLAVGDVSGKGMPAALLMANLQASLRTLVKLDLPMEELVERLNAALYSNTAPQMFATFFFGWLDAQTGRFDYVNAGHNYPILCGNDRQEQLTEGGLLLGVMPEGKYQAGNVTLQSGELVAVYSDGITEAVDAAGKEFGEDRLVELLSRRCDEKAESILQAVLGEVEGYCGTPQDDVTLMVVKRV